MEKVIHQNWEVFWHRSDKYLIGYLYLSDRAMIGMGKPAGPFSLKKDFLIKKQLLM
jgi:hypothetical protein